MTTKMTEDKFLEERIGRSVAIYLTTGIRLLGVLEDHGCEVVFLRPHGVHASNSQMIFKYAISTICAASESADCSPDDLGGMLAGSVRRRRM